MSVLVTGHKDGYFWHGISRIVKHLCAMDEEVREMQDEM